MYVSVYIYIYIERERDRYRYRDMYVKPQPCRNRIDRTETYPAYIMFTVAAQS